MAVTHRRGAKVLSVVLVWFTGVHLFSLPKKMEKRSSIKPRNAMTSVDVPMVSQISENLPTADADAMADNVIAVRTEAEFSEVLEGVETDHLLVVDYYAPWCKPCQKLLRYVHRIAPEPTLRDVHFATVDLDRSEELVKLRSVDRFPTMEIYRGQELKQRWSGANTKRFLERLEGELDQMSQTAVSGTSSTSS
eukprot:symbB.v1.2.012511.t1/scaffold866.1/size156716/6